MDYSDACSVLNIMNGPWIDQASKGKFLEFTFTKRNSDSQKEKKKKKKKGKISTDIPKLNKSKTEGWH